MQLVHGSATEGRRERGRREVRPVVELRGWTILFGCALACSLLLVPARRAAGLERASNPTWQRDSTRPLTGRLPAARLAQFPVRPSVTGLSYSAAEERLRALKITVVRRDSVSPDARPETVLTQLPSAGTRIAPGAVDTLVIAVPLLGTVTVPRVIDRPYREAVMLLRKRRLTAIGPSISATDSAEAVVVEQSPDPGTQTHPGAAVRLGIALRVLVEVPPVVGRDTLTAARILGHVGLRLGRIQTGHDDRVPAGLIFRQRPAARDSVPREAVVDVAVSLGPHEERTAVEVPSVIGLTLGAAADVLGQRLLNIGTVDSTRRPDGRGRIILQRPSPRDSAHAGDLVHVTVAVPGPLIRAPDLVGLQLSVAADTLRRLGLALGMVRIVRAADARDSQVVAQSPPADSRVAEGGRLDVEVNRAPVVTGVIVPPVTGLSEADGSLVLMEAGLHVGTRAYLDGPAGEILSQSPAAFDTVDAGTAVTLEVGRLPTREPPDLRGVPFVREAVLDSAVRVVRDSGFSNLVVDSIPVEFAGLVGWIVVDQSPEGGARVAPATLVRLRASPVLLVQVPALEGSTLPEAESIVRSLELGSAIVQRGLGFRLRGSVVRSHEPRAGTVVRPGYVIGLYVTDPIPPGVTLTAAAVAVAGLLLIGAKVIPKGSGGPPPGTATFHSSVDAEAPRVEGPDDRAVTALEFGFRVSVETYPPGVEGHPEDLTTANGGDRT